MSVDTAAEHRTDISLTKIGGNIGARIDGVARRRPRQATVARIERRFWNTKSSSSGSSITSMTLDSRRSGDCSVNSPTTSDVRSVGLGTSCRRRRIRPGEQLALRWHLRRPHPAFSVLRAVTIRLTAVRRCRPTPPPPTPICPTRSTLAEGCGPFTQSLRLFTSCRRASHQRYRREGAGPVMSSVPKCTRRHPVVRSIRDR